MLRLESSENGYSEDPVTTVTKVMVTTKPPPVGLDLMPGPTSELRLQN
jgi:hypothetical protein